MARCCHSSISICLIASFWYGIDAKGKVALETHLTRYMNFMPKDLSGYLVPNSGFRGSMQDLKDFLGEVQKLGADDVILVPTHTNLDEISQLAKLLF